jgi:protein TonB
MVRRAVDEMTVVRISTPPPPPPIARPAQRRPKSQLINKPQGPPAKKLESAPVAAPEVRALPTPLPTTKVAGSGAAASTGAALAGNGKGQSGSGSGAGGGGYADYSRFTPARLIANIPNSQYRQLASTGIPSGLVGVTILVAANGSVSNCRIARSSGDPSIDSLVCALTVRYVRFDPARDPYGRPVAQDITYFPNWRPR